MKRDIRILLVLLYTMVYTICLGQNTAVQYYYDNCGNRIERSLSFKKIEENGRLLEDKEEKSWQMVTESCFKSIKTSLYPNPTNGKFSLSFSKKPDGGIHAELFTIEGAVIEKRQLYGVVEEFDLSRQPAGVYLLRLSADYYTETWKVIKKN